MKKILICFVCLLGMNLSVFSQGNPEERVEKLIEKLEEKADLSQEKEDGLKVIFKEFFSSMREAGRGNRSQMETLTKERDQKVEKLLNEQEYKIYSEMMEKPSKEGLRRRNGN